MSARHRRLLLSITAMLAEANDCAVTLRIWDQARKHVVESEIDCHQDDVRMRMEKRHGLGQLGLAGRSAMIASSEKGHGRLAWTSKLDELKAAPSEPLQCQEIIGVSRMSRLSFGAANGGLDTKGTRSTKCEVVRDMDRCVRRAHRTRLRCTDRDK